MSFRVLESIPSVRFVVYRGLYKRVGQDARPFPHVEGLAIESNSEAFEEVVGLFPNIKILRLDKCSVCDLERCCTMRLTPSLFLDSG